ncbi:hypothetical protein [Nitrososphaera sp.]|uniref:hypothetical protein n=1 Tax=Nitrososphaera sp. TaxID=1971748 RepID=UPI002EDA555F
MMHSDDIPVTVFVRSTSGSEVASKLTGYFVLKGQEFRFRAIAFGRIGGHNASVTISKNTLAKVAKMGFDPDALIMTIQRKIVEGDVTLPEGIRPPSE